MYLATFCRFSGRFWKKIQEKLKAKRPDFGLIHSTKTSPKSISIIAQKLHGFKAPLCFLDRFIQSIFAVLRSFSDKIQAKLMAKTAANINPRSSPKIEIIKTISMSHCVSSKVHDKQQSHNFGTLIISRFDEFPNTHRLNNNSRPNRKSFFFASVILGQKKEEGFKSANITSLRFSFQGFVRSLVLARRDMDKSTSLRGELVWFGLHNVILPSIPIFWPLLNAIFYSFSLRNPSYFAKNRSFFKSWISH